MNEVELKKEVLYLISLKQEGEYWDFKREWYNTKNKERLLHDILCMSNNTTSDYSYIIIGVDEELNYNIHGVNNDPNRMNTQKIVDFLHSKSFCGGTKPLVYIKTISIDELDVDVIIIKNDDNVPYYLEKDYHKVRTGHIYTRTGDTNTPISETSSQVVVENLWKKRMGLDLAPIDKIQKYLRDKDNWEDGLDGEIRYYKFAPEFRIEECEDHIRTSYEYYMFTQTDKTPHWEQLKLFYHQTLLKTVLCNCLDGARSIVVVPELSYLHSKDNYTEICYRYYIEGTLKWILNEYLFDNDNYDEIYSRQAFMNSILVLNDESEKNEFDKYTCENYSNYDYESYKKELPYMSIEGINTDSLKNDFINSLIIKDIYSAFKKGI